MSDRPNPLGRVAATVGTTFAGLAGLIGAVVELHVLTQAQADALNYAGHELPTAVLVVGGLVTLVTGAVSGLAGAFGTAKFGKDHVTPISSPRNNDGVPLVPGPRI